MLSNVHSWYPHMYAAPSAPPQNLDGFAIDHTSISLSWNPPPVHLQNGIITEYRINITERETGLVFQYTTTSTSIVIPSLHPDYIYDCIVAAFTVDLGPYSASFGVRVLVAGEIVHIKLLIHGLSMSRQASKLTS